LIIYVKKNWLCLHY